MKRRVWEIQERELNAEQSSTFGTNVRLQAIVLGCGQKVAYFLKKEHNSELSVPKIYEIISEKYQLTAKGRKKHKQGEVPFGGNITTTARIWALTRCARR